MATVLYVDPSKKNLGPSRVDEKAGPSLLNKQADPMDP